MIFDGLWMDHYLWTFAGTRVLGGPSRRGRSSAAAASASTPWPARCAAPTISSGACSACRPTGTATSRTRHRAIDDARGFANVLAKLFSISGSLPQGRSDRKRLQMKFTLDWLKDHLETDGDGRRDRRGADHDRPRSRKRRGPGQGAEGRSSSPMWSRPSSIPTPTSSRSARSMPAPATLIDVVCGAPNAVTGMKSVFAFPGTYIPGKDFDAQGRRRDPRRAVATACCARPPNSQLSDDHDGIIVLPDDAPVGMPYVDYAGSAAWCSTFRITPNRGDATGVYGIARDLAAFGLGTLKPTDMSPSPLAGRQSPIAAAAAELRRRRAQGHPQVRRPLHQGRQERPVARLAAAAPARRRPAPDQRAGRHHQFRLARLGPAAARLRCRQAHRHHAAAQCPGRRKARRRSTARRYALDDDHVRHRRRHRPALPRRHHGRRAARLHRRRRSTSSSNAPGGTRR